MLQCKLYKHKSSGEFLRLIKLRKSNVNTFLQVSEDNEPIIKSRSWSIRPTEQNRIVTGFENLVKI
jgi:hypothetical protein